MAADNTPAATHTADGSQNPRSVISFLIPTKTPLLTSNLLYAAKETGQFVDTSFVLLLSREDPHLLAYREIVDKLRESGMDVGYFIFDGTPYAGMVNRVAPILSTEYVCVIDNTHMPMTSDGRTIGTVLAEWSKQSPQIMEVGTWQNEAMYPVVSRKLIDRLGYMFHPLCYGRDEAENWLILIATSIGVLREIPGTKLIEAKVDTIDTIGMSDADDADWAEETLLQTLDDVADHLTYHLVK